MRCFLFWCGIGFACLLPACSLLAGNNYAPVVDAWYQSNAKASVYHVKEGDTLYSVAWAFGLDYRDLAQKNHLSPPYKIAKGQVLEMVTASITDKGYQDELKNRRLSVNSLDQTTETVLQAIPVNPVNSSNRWAKAKKNTSNPVVGDYSGLHQWVWPAQGKVSVWSKSWVGDKGINILGRYGEAVRASSAGQVVYSGSGIRGYGKLIIVKHDNGFLSAYAFNANLLVGEGVFIKQGQQIAQMGRGPNGVDLLHFELRKDGKSLDPLKYLPQSS